MSLKDTDVRTPGDAAIAKKFKLSLAKVRKLVDVGAKHEKEHNTNLAKAKEVARDHIGERPDYYKMLNKAERSDKNKLKEEIGTSGVRGFGNVTGDPAIGNNSYADTNAMSYEDENGNKLQWIKKNTEGHNAVGFKEFDPTELTKKVKLKEGISAGPERSANYNIGDAGGGRTLMRPLDVKEGAKIEKAKKLAAAGLTAANLYTLGDVTSRAVEGNKTVSAKHDVVKAASALPGPAGYAASAINYAKQAYDKVKHMKEENDLKGACWKGYTAKGLKKKGGKMVPNCVPVSEQGSPANPARYTERPTYEMKEPDNKLSSGEVARGIYEGRPATRQKPEIVKHNDKDVGKVWSHPDGSFSSVRKKGQYKVSMRHKTREGAIQHLKDKSSEMTEGYASIGHSFDWAGDVNTRAKFYGKKPKATTTKNDEKNDTYKDSKQGGKVTFAKAVRKEDIADKDWDDTTGKKLPENHNKPDTRYAPGATGITKTIYEETKMDTKDHINEALDNILENNLNEMRDHLLAALQEKAMEKLEEKKKDIAANYFAQ